MPPETDTRTFYLAAQNVLQHLYPEATDLDYLNTGNNSVVFQFKANGKARVVKLSERNVFNFEKYRLSTFAHDNLPLPQPAQQGQVGPYFYFIQDMCPGYKPDYAQVSEWFPDLVKHLLTLHRTAMPLTQPATVHRTDINWAQFLSNHLGFQKKIYLRYQQSPQFDAQLHNILVKHLIESLPFCQVPLFQIHGDLHIGNLKVTGQNLTGILDFSSYCYGDFLFDYSWALLYSPPEVVFKHIDMLYYHASEAGFPLEHFVERLGACLIKVGMIQMAHKAVIKQDWEGFNLLKHNLRTLFNAPQRWQK